MKSLLPVFLFCLLLLPIVTATITTDPTTINLNPNTPSQLVQFLRSSDDNTTSLSLSVSTNLQNIISMNFNTISFPTNTFITVSTQGNAPPGSYTGSIMYANQTLPVSVFVQQNTTTSAPGTVTVFPTTKTTTVQQGKEKTQNILISVPSTYPRPVTIEAADFNPGTETIQFDELNLGTIQPGSSINIPIKFTGIDAQTGTYQTDLRFSAKDSTGSISLPTVSLTLQVTTGVTPLTGTTFSSPPACSLTTKDLSLNQTYSFTCSNAVANIDIIIPYNEYWQGTKVETNNGIYKYDFIPTKPGSTNFTATFQSKGATIFAAYNEPVRISSTGNLLPGTTLSLHYTPSLDQTEGDEPILIQIIDNKTGSLVQNARLLINAQEVNHSSDTFSYTFENGKEYEVRGISDGYPNIVQKVLINPEPVTIIASPSSGNTNTLISITTIPENATLTLNGQPILNPYYSTLSQGSNLIVAKQKGYKTTNTTINIEHKITASPDTATIKKGKSFNITLSQTTQYKINYVESITDTTTETLITGTGSLVELKPKNKGIYQVEVDGTTIGTYTTEDTFLTNTTLKIPNWVWLVIIIGIIILILIILIIRANNEPFHPSDGGGFHYNIGGND